MKRILLNTKYAGRRFGGEMPKFDIILDSGAFSAWRLGKEINLEKYCDFLVDNSDWITTSVALDVINPGDPEAAARASFDNYSYMRRRGLRPVPVFHVGESIDWLHRMLDAGADYIGLSASSIVARNQADDWYSLAWSFLVDAKGLPIVKAHAFGEGRVASLMQFPWYSADSTSWIYSSQRSGIIQLDDFRRISFRNDGLSTKSSPDLTGLPEHDMPILLEVLRKAGVNPNLLEKRASKGAFITRCFLAALYYMDMERRVSALCPIHFQRHGFLMNHFSPKPAVDIPSFKMHLVMGGNYTAWTALSVAKHPRVLASYFYIQAGTHFAHLRAYMEDPTKTVTTMMPFRTHYDLLMENLVEEIAV